MGNVILRYGDAGKGEFEERPSTFIDLKNRLEQIKNEYNTLLGIPYSVDILIEGVGRLSVGLGNDKWMLFYYSDDDNSVLNSLGDEKAVGSELFFFGDQTLLSKKYLIPSDDALKVIKKWFEDGMLSNAIKWTDEIF